jgi:hypothetical protein
VSVPSSTGNEVWIFTSSPVEDGTDSVPKLRLLIFRRREKYPEYNQSCMVLLAWFYAIQNMILKKMLDRHHFLNLLKPTDYIQELYALPTLHLCVVYLRTNSVLCHIINWWVFITEKEKCLQRGTNWVFKKSSLRFVFKGSRQNFILSIALIFRDALGCRPFFVLACAG